MSTAIQKKQIRVNKQRFIFGLIVSLMTLISFLVQFFYIERAILVEGYVTDVIINYDKEDNEVYTPLIAFSAHDGKQYQIKARMSTRPPNADETLTIIYNPDNPSDAKIWSVVNTWGITLLFAFVALAILISSLRFSQGSEAQWPL